MINSIEISALARLVETGAIKVGVKNDSLVRRFETARWIVLGVRKSEWVIRPDKKFCMEERLSILMPSWREDFSFLRSIGRDPYAPSDIEALPMLRRQRIVSGTMVNRRNWNAAAGLGPKHKAKVSAHASLTKDWVLRFRPNAGLVCKQSSGITDLAEMAVIWTECLIPERAWTGIQTFSGVLPAAVITCENLGAYIDLPVNDSTLVIYSPGADTESAVALLKLLPATSVWLHFGDLDPEGIDIAQRLSVETNRDMKLLIPFFAEDYIDAARPVETAWGDVPDIQLLRALKEKRKRIFQEVFMLDERLSDALESLPLLHNNLLPIAHKL